MTLIVPALAERSAMLTSPSAPVAPDRASAILHATRLLLPTLERGHALDATTLRAAMEAAFGASDTGGAWVWKDAYEACEATLVVFLRRHGPAMRARAGSPAAMLAMLAKLAALVPTHTRRSEESVALQQFSTPIALGFAASLAAAITPGDLVLEPSAGTGLLAAFAALAGGALALNELAGTRADLLAHLFPGAPVSRHDAAQIHDYLDPAIAPSVVLMNPPFSAAAHVEGRMADAAFRHVASALARLLPRGRLVAITGISLAPDNPFWREDFVRLQARGRVAFSAGIDRRIYARHGTAVETRLTVIDRVPAEDPTAFPPFPGIAPDAATLLEWVTRLVPPRPALSARPVAAPAARPVPPRAMAPCRHPTPTRHPEPAIDPGTPLVYEVREEPPPESGRISDALYESYSVQTIAIPDARPHPTRLVQSAAMASVAPPRPRYRPHATAGDRVVRPAVGRADRERHLRGRSPCRASRRRLAGRCDLRPGLRRPRRRRGRGALPSRLVPRRRHRRRQGAAGCRRHSRQLAEGPPPRALGLEIRQADRGRPARLVRTRPGAAADHSARALPPGHADPPRPRASCSPPTPRCGRPSGKARPRGSIRSSTGWGGISTGSIVFDEAHAMANAAGDTSERGERGPSQQGRAGLRLQHALPDARVLYVSATGATSVQNLAYAQRLGLWGGDGFPVCDAAANSSPRWRPAASPRWRCWRGI